MQGGTNLTVVALLHECMYTKQPRHILIYGIPLSPPHLDLRDTSERLLAVAVYLKLLPDKTSFEADIFVQQALPKR